MPLLVMTVDVAVYGESTPLQENVTPQDSTIDIIGWFNENDTLTYWIHESSWRIDGVDTVNPGLCRPKSV